MISFSLHGRGSEDENREESWTFCSALHIGSAADWAGLQPWAPSFGLAVREAAASGLDDLEVSAPPERSSHYPRSVLAVPRRPPLLLLSVRHIGPRRALRLIDGLGEDWVELVDADPERVFATLRGMGRRRARIAAASWREIRRSRCARD